MMKWSKLWQQHKRWWLGSSAVFWLTTLPWLSQTPFNWDAAQFELGVHHFSIVMHQPHPPGYPLFILCGRILAQLVSVHVALLIVTVIVAWAATLVLYWIIWRLVGKRWLAGIVTLLFVLNPMFWFYRELDLTYTIDALASILLGGLALLSQHSLLLTQQRRYLYISAGVLAIAAGFRPSLFVLLSGLVVWQWWLMRKQPTPWRAIVISLGIMIGLVLVWFVPMLWLTGWHEYWAASLALYSQAASSTSWMAGATLRSGSMQLYYGLAVVTATLNVLVIVFVVAAAIYATQLIQGQRRLHWSYAGLGVAWLLPSIIIYGFVHFGQNGYILTVLPPLYLLLAGMIWWTKQRLGTLWLGSGLIIIGLIQIIIFTVFSPIYTHPDYQPMRGIDVVLQWLARANPILFKMNQSLISLTDVDHRSWRSLIKQYPADQTLILAPSGLAYRANNSAEKINNDNAFRELSVMVPDYLIVELPTKQDVGHTELQYQRLDIAGRTLTVPNRIRYVIISANQIDTDQLPNGLLVEQRFMATGVSYYYGIMNDQFSWLGFTVKHEQL